MQSHKQKIEVLPYDPLWPELFINEAGKIKSALGENFINVHHVGSTAIPGLAAKPKIDIIAVVTRNHPLMRYSFIKIRPIR